MEIGTIFQRLFEVPECLKLINNRDQSEEVPLHIAARKVGEDQGGGFQILSKRAVNLIENREN